MDPGQARVRRRGLFLYSDAGDAESGDHEAAEGVHIRAGTNRRAGDRRSSLSGGRTRAADEERNDEAPAVRSGNATGSRRRADSRR